MCGSFVPGVTAIATNLSQRIESGQKIGLEEIAANLVEYLLGHEALFRRMTHFMVDGGISQEALGLFNPNRAPPAGRI